MIENNFIAIEGVIGVGKTTLARLLQPAFNAGILLEVVEENPFLPRFYADRERFAFQTQLFFLLSRYHQQYQAVPDALSQGTLISDYTFAKDELFAWLNLRDDELAMYGRVHAALGEKIPRPDLIVYLRADHDIIMRRIALRDRPFERDIDPEYIREVATAYDAWLSRLNDIPVLTIDTNELDYLSRSQDLDQVAALIKTELSTARKRPSETLSTQLNDLDHGRMATIQQVHQQIDLSNGHESNLYLDYLRLINGAGKLAADLADIWSTSQKQTPTIEVLPDMGGETFDPYREILREDLTSLLAHLLRLANRTGIDLEQAYLDKLQEIDEDE